jgi:hypothetical protein
VYGLTVEAEKGSGFAAVTDAGACAVSLMATIAPPSLLLQGSGGLSCLGALPAGNVTASGTPTGSSIQVAGHNAYLPSTVAEYLIGSLGLPVAQPTAHSKVRVDAAHNLTATESAPLMRCSAGDAYPPTSASCPSLVSTGVRFMRVVSVVHGAHQVRLRDSFTSTNGAKHRVTLDYIDEVPAPETGAAGFDFTGKGAVFRGFTPGTVVRAIGPRAGSVLIRSDRFALSNDAAASTIGLSWSRPPNQAHFGHDSDTLGLRYGVTVPAHQSAYLGFAVSSEPTTAAVKPLVAAGIREMVGRPTVTSPRRIKGQTTTVTGSVPLGANGLVTAVTVDGHRATLTQHGSSTSFKATFKEPLGAHTITVAAADSFGNKASTTIKVRNA